MGSEGQSQALASGRSRATRGALIVPNPKLKLLDQVREILRLKHYSIRTEQA